MPQPYQPTLAELAYLAWCQCQPTPQPLYKALTFAERLGWAMGVDAALADAFTVPLGPCLAAPQLSLGAALTSLRQRVVRQMQAQQLSFNAMGKVASVDRRTLTRWVAGEENVTVQTVLALEAWVEQAERHEERCC